MENSFAPAFDPDTMNFLIALQTGFLQQKTSYQEQAECREKEAQALRDRKEELRAYLEELVSDSNIKSKIIEQQEKHIDYLNTRS